MRSGIIAQLLRDRGHEVTWWASAFRHATREFRRYSGQCVEWNGIKIMLARSPGYRRNVSFARMWDHHRLGVTMTRMARAQPVPDLIHCGYPPLEVCEAMTRYGRIHSVPVVVDVRDMWPEAFMSFVPRALRLLARPAIALFNHRARRMLADATAIQGHTHHFVEYGLMKAGRPVGRYDNAYPFAYEPLQPDDGARMQAAEFWDSRGLARDSNWLTVCFFGNLNTERDDVNLQTVCRALKIMEKGTIRARAVICGAGRLADQIRRDFGDSGPAIYLPGFVDAASIRELMQRSDLGLLPYLPSKDFMNSLPNKSIEYLSGGLPILTSMTSGYLFESFSIARCIVTYESGDSPALARKLEQLSRDRSRIATMSRNASELFERAFRADVVYLRLVQELENIALESKLCATGTGDKGAA